MREIKEEQCFPSLGKEKITYLYDQWAYHYDLRFVGTAFLTAVRGTKPF